MNNIEQLSISDFHIGDIVVHILPNGDKNDEGVVVGKDSRHVEVLFDDDIRPKQMSVFSLRKVR